jgi:hypothetical protein
MEGRKEERHKEMKKIRNRARTRKNEREIN